MPTPRIGITAYRVEAQWGMWRTNAALLPETYMNFVAAGHGMPIILPATAADPCSAIEGLDALLLSGGPDVSPERYHADRHPRAENNDAVRDEWELRLLSVALKRELPVLAICRGMQLLNVAYHGTLHQHVPDVVRSDTHRISIGQFQDNLIRSVPGSRVEGIVGAAVRVPCHHHQAVAEVGVGLVPSAYATDGVLEAVEDATRPFVIGVQWHPEEGSDASLAAALANAAAGVDVARCRA